MSGGEESEFTWMGDVTASEGTVVCCRIGNRRKGKTDGRKSSSAVAVGRAISRRTPLAGRRVNKNFSCRSRRKMNCCFRLVSNIFPFLLQRDLKHWTKKLRMNVNISELSNQSNCQCQTDLSGAWLRWRLIMSMPFFARRGEQFILGDVQ